MTLFGLNPCPLGHACDVGSRCPLPPPQIFILITIKEFGALLFATIMTTRQFLSILLSCILFMHPLSLGQWVGTTLVFGALYYKTLTGGAGKGKKTDVTMR